MSKGATSMHAAGSALLAMAVISNAAILSGCARSTGQSQAAEKPVLHPLPIPGFEKLRWEMTQSQILANYPDFKDGYEGRWGADGKIDDHGFHMLQWRGYSIGSCKFEIDLSFFNPPTDSLTYFTFYFTDGNFADCRAKSLASLVARFGDKPVLSPGGDVNYRQWAGLETTVWFTDTNVIAKPSFNFSFAHTDAPGTYLD